MSQYGPGDRPPAVKPRKRKTPSPGPPNFPTAVPVRPGAVTTPSTRGHGPPPPPRPTIGKTPQLERAPGQRQAQRAGKRAARARPAPVLPQVPIIRNPTQKQIVAAKVAISAGLSRESKARGQDPVTTMRQLAADPRTRQFARAASHYARADERANAARIGRSAPVAPPAPVNPLGDLAAMGFEVPSNLSQRSRDIRVGRGLAVAQQQRNRYSLARRPRTLSLGPTSLPIGAAAKLAGRAIAGATTLDTGDIGPRSAFGKVAADVKTLGEAPFIGGITLSAAAVEGLRKHPYLLAGGPLFGGVTAAGTTKRGQALAKGVAQQYVQEAQHPLRYAGQHPLLAAVDVAGAGSVLGRTAGALARGAGSTAEAGGIRGALARAGSTVRPPIALTNDPEAAVRGARISRSYSKDATRKFFQVGQDNAREPLRRADGSIVTVRERGREVPVLKAHPHEDALGVTEHRQRTQADFEHARANAMERQARVEASKESKVGVREAGVRKRTRDVVAMVTEGTITSAKHFEADLRSHHDRIAAHLRREAKEPGSVYRHPDDIRKAKERVKLADSILGDPKALAQAKRIVAAGERHGGQLVAGDVRAAELKLADAEELRRARLKVTAVEHLGARHFTVEEHARLERNALQVEAVARDRVAAAPAGSPEKLAARAEFSAAREHRIAVSGREPARVHEHETAVARARNARVRHQQAQASIARLARSRQRLVGAQASRRGRRQAEALGGELKTRAGERPAGKATVAEQRKLAKIDQLLKQARAQERDLRSARTIAEHRVRETPMPAAGEGLRTAEGKHLPTEDIEAFLRSRGRDPGTVAYLPPEVSSRQFHSQFRPGSRGTLTGGETRTGAAHLKGTTEASAELLRAAGVRQAVAINKAEAIDRQIADHGLRHPAWGKAQAGKQLTAAERRIVARGGLWNGREAAEAIDRLQHTEGKRYVAVRAYPGKLDAETQRIIREELQGPGGMESLGERLLNDRLVSTEEAFSSRARNIVLMPAAQIERQLEHLKPAGDLGRFFQFINRPFRMAVLPQPRWLAGNFAEPYVVRLTASGSGLNVFGLANDIRATSKVLKSMERSGDPRVRAAAKELRAQQTGSGLFVGGGEARSIHRKLADISPNAYGALVSKLPVVGQMADMVGQAAHYLALPLRAFFHANLVIERGAQRAGFGRDVRRDIQDFTGSWTESMRLGQKAVDEAARGLVDTPTQRRFMQSQYELLGKYAGFGPKVRALVQGPAPFLPWALNAARFVYWTMPAHHSALTSVLIKTNDVVAKDWQDLHADVPPGGLKLATKGGKGGWVDLSRYTPYGFTGPISEGELSGISGEFVPQLQGFQNALDGKDPFGRDLKVKPTPSNPTGKPTTAQKWGIAVYSLLEAMAPYLSTARRLQEKGGTAYAGSTVLSPQIKPGSSHMTAFRRTFDPFRPTYLKGPTVKFTGVIPQGGPVSRQDQILVKAAERQSAGGLSDRQLQILERAALRAASGR
jgi:hypothetical protein